MSSTSASKCIDDVARRFQFPSDWIDPRLTITMTNITKRWLLIHPIDNSTHILTAKHTHTYMFVHGSAVSLFDAKCCLKIPYSIFVCDYLKTQNHASPICWVFISPPKIINVNIIFRETKARFYSYFFNSKLCPSNDRVNVSSSTMWYWRRRYSAACCRRKPFISA